MKKICFFGIYDPEYSRNMVLRRALEENDFQILECNINPRIYHGLRKYTALLEQFKKIKHERFEYVIVCFPGHSVVWFARILFGKRIIFDAFLSLYDSNVNDRKLYSCYHPRAWYDWFLDWSSCLLAWRVLIDTHQHAMYLSQSFFVPHNKIIRFLVSTDETIFYPRTKSSNIRPYTVHFHGTYIPLQGIRYILDAAHILQEEDIVFKLIGHGQEYSEMKSYAERLDLEKAKFMARVPLEELPMYIANSDVCLGIFGSTEKAKRVIPNKVYEYAAMGKAVITADTPAIREVFTHERNVILCTGGDGKAIAKAIFALKSNRGLAYQIGIGARELFEKKLKAKMLGEELLKELK